MTDTSFERIDYLNVTEQRGSGHLSMTLIRVAQNRDCDGREGVECVSMRQRQNREEEQEIIRDVIVAKLEM